MPLLLFCAFRSASKRYANQIIQRLTNGIFFKSK